MATPQFLTRGREAFARHAWADAFAQLSSADQESDLALDDLERLATAAYLSGHDRSSTAAWARAHRTCMHAGDEERAVLCAFWLAFGLIQRGETAEGGGWLARAGHLVEQHRLDCVGCGYLLVPRALLCLGNRAFVDGFELFEAAGAVADRFDDADLSALSRLGRGQASFAMDRSGDGATWFDEAMVMVTNGDLSPVVSGIVYCAVIDECQRAFDVDRAHAWTSALSRWCDSEPDLVPYRGQCLVHRSQVLQLHGAWPEALNEARRAEERLSSPPHPAIGMAHYQLGELQRLRGELDEAESSYHRAQELGRSPQPGLALARLATGDVDSAAATIDAALAGAIDAVTRVQQLPAFVEIMLSAGRVDRAREGAEALTVAAEGARTPYLDAAAACAVGAVVLAEHDPRAALPRLRTALDLWQRLEMPYEAARTRLLISEACQAIGDHETAHLEDDAAKRTLAELGATVPSRTRSRPNGRTEPSTSTATDHRHVGLTDRELQVLRRVATGMTNREIADDLYISIKTVERHLSNVFVKLGVPNRAAATARALDAGLL